MTAFFRDPAAICHILRQDPELLAAIPVADRSRATDVCTAPVVEVRRGRSRVEWPNFDDDAIGLLVLQGVLVRSVGDDARLGAEVLGQGDLLRPWQEDGTRPTGLRTFRWRALERTLVAVLDAQTFAQYPELTARLVGRALERSRKLLLYMAIVHQPQVDVRLHMLFWHLADRWGHVHGEGVLLPIRLTHTVLADLVAAKRPAVSASLAELAGRRLVRPVGDDWLLTGQPPSELERPRDELIGRHVTATPGQPGR